MIFHLNLFPSKKLNSHVREENGWNCWFSSPDLTLLSAGLPGLRRQLHWLLLLLQHELGQLRGVPEDDDDSR